jgi:hypothetical protein
MGERTGKSFAKNMGWHGKGDITYIKSEGNWRDISSLLKKNSST